MSWKHKFAGMVSKTWTGIIEMNNVINEQALIERNNQVKVEHCKFVTYDTSINFAKTVWCPSKLV